MELNNLSPISNFHYNLVIYWRMINNPDKRISKNNIMIISNEKKKTINDCIFFI